MSHKLVSLYIGDGEYYTRTDADTVIAEKDVEIAELERMDTEHTLQIAKMNGYIHHLEEERRWRKFSEEKPNDKQVVLVCGDDYYNIAIYHDDGEIDFGDDIHFSNITETPYWMPRPPEPKEMQE